MAFDVDKLDSKNTPVRWRIVGKDLVDNDPAQLDKLDPVYKAALEKAATFTSDDEMGIGNQPEVGSEPDPIVEPILVTGIALTGADATYELDGAVPANNAKNFGADVLPSDADDATFAFSTSDAGVVAITETYGLVEIVAAGTAIITVTANDGSGITDFIEITVTDDIVEE